MIGTKLQKPLQDDFLTINEGEHTEQIPNPAPNTLSKYSECAEWCNANNAAIEDKGEYYEVVAIPAPSLADLKQAKLQALKAERDKLEVEPITWNGHAYDYDEKARDRINAAIIALEAQGEGANIAWTLADNTSVTVTANDLRMVIANVAIRSNALHVAYRDAKDKVNACSSKDELDKIILEVHNA